MRKAFSCDCMDVLVSKMVVDVGRLTIGKVLTILSLSIRLLNRLRKNRPDLVYMTFSENGLSLYKDLFFTFILKLFRVKRVYHIHTKGVRFNQKRFFIGRYYRYVLKNADVIMLSQHLYPDISEYVPEEKLHICHNGIPEIAFPDAENKKDNTVVEILFLSKLIKTKGILDLLDALRILKLKGIPFHCNIIGGENEITRKDISRITARYEIAQEVHYLDRQFGKAKQRLFEQADIFAFPTYYKYESFPLVILEAMQASLPVISTFEGGIPDMVKDRKTGYLIPPMSPDILAKKLERLISDKKLRQKMGTAGRLKYEKQFTMAHFENRFTDILNSVLEKD